MRLILEKEEIVSILSKHFDADLDPDKVVVRTNPLEIEVHGLPLAATESPPKKKPVLSALEVPTPVKEAAEDVHPAAILSTSKSLERELDQEKAKRRSGSYTYDAPAFSEDET